jgi:hypothetical protein
MVQDEFQRALEGAAAKLLYPSETDAPMKVHRVGADRFQGLPAEADILGMFFKGSPLPERMGTAPMDGPCTEGYRHFFRHLTDFITCLPGGGFMPRTPAEREFALQWRHLRDLWMDYLVSQYWFKAHLADGVRKRIFIAGQFLHLTFQPDTNVMTAQPGDWFILETESVET